MNDAIITEYVELCEQIAAIELLDHETAEKRLYARLDELWYSMSGDERSEAEDRLVAKARRWHDDRRSEDP